MQHSWGETGRRTCDERARDEDEDELPRRAGRLHRRRAGGDGRDAAARAAVGLRDPAPDRRGGRALEGDPGAGGGGRGPRRVRHGPARGGAETLIVMAVLTRVTTVHPPMK